MMAALPLQRDDRNIATHVLQLGSPGKLDTGGRTGIPYTCQAHNGYAKCSAQALIQAPL